MGKVSSIAQELSSKIGLESAPLTEDVEKGAIRRFLQAIGDGDFDRAEGDEVVAPPTFLCTLKYLERLSLDIPLSGLLAAGDEFHFYKPLKPGDKITSRQRLAEVYEKSGRIGDMLLVVFETSFVNQNNELAAVLRHSSIFYDY